MPPFAQGVSERLGRVIGCGHVSGLQMRLFDALIGVLWAMITWRATMLLWSVDPLFALVVGTGCLLVVLDKMVTALSGWRVEIK